MRRPSAHFLQARRGQSKAWIHRRHERTESLSPKGREEPAWELPLPEKVHPAEPQSLLQVQTRLLIPSQTQVIQTPPSSMPDGSILILMQRLSTSGLRQTREPPWWMAMLRLRPEVR